MDHAKHVSALVHDHKEKPLDRAIWWIDWILRHPNVNSLQSPVIRMGYIIGNSLDVIGFSAMVLIVQIFILFKLFCFLFVERINIFKRFFSRKKTCDNIDIDKKQQ